jgi:hypothetical protein
VLELIQDKPSDHGKEAAANLPNRPDKPSRYGSEPQRRINYRENNVEPLPIKVLEAVTSDNSYSRKTTTNPLHKCCPASIEILDIHSARFWHAQDVSFTVSHLDHYHMPTIYVASF